MPSNLFTQQYVSDTAPKGAVLGDEWLNSKTGKLYKQTLVSGAVSWVDISPLPVPGASGNVLTSNGTNWVSGAVTSSGGGGSASTTKTISNISAAYTVVASDLGKIINCTSGTFTISITAAATLGTGFTCTIWNTSNTATDAITIDPSDAETIDGISTLQLRRGEGLAIVCDGTNWQIDNKKPMRMYAENLTAVWARPTCSGSGAIAIGESSSSSGLESYAFGYGANATATEASAIGTRATASSNYSTSIGENSAQQGSKTITGAGAMALGGSYASGTDSFAAAVANNTSTYGANGNNSIAIGKNATTNGFNSISIGNAALNNGSNGIAIGSSCTTSNGGVSIGSSNNAVADKTFSIGYYSQTNQYGKFAYASGLFAVNGDAQSGKIVLRASTTTNTSVVLTSDGAAASTSNQLILSANQAMMITGTIIAKQSASANMSAYKFIVSAVNNAGTVTISSVSLTTIIDTIALTTQPIFTVDAPNAALAITSGNKATTNIRWVANIDSAEVVYA